MTEQIVCVNIYQYFRRFQQLSYSFMIAVEAWEDLDTFKNLITFKTSSRLKASKVNENLYNVHT